MADNLSIYGTITIENGEYESIKVYGSATSHNYLSVGFLDVTGNFNFYECSGKNIKICGDFHGDSIIHSECFDAFVSSDCKCAKIDANQVHIIVTKRKSIFKRPTVYTVYCDEVSGETITAENLVSKKVRGKVINLKGFSKIDELIYTESYTAEDSCEIKKIIHDV